MAQCNKTFDFVKKCFFTGLAFVSTLTNSFSCISMNNQEFKVRIQIVNANNDGPLLFLFSIKTSKCSGSCNSINDPPAKVCVPEVLKNLNVKVFNLMSRTNETRPIEWHETCKYKCRDDGSDCNNKKGHNNDKCRCECKELINKKMYDKGYIWNPSNCKCKCNKSCNVGEYLDYESRNFRRKLVD